jgi:Na+/H+-dicarboxylate symporter
MIQSSQIRPPSPEPPPQPPRRSPLRNYAFSLILIGSVVVGSILGLLLGKNADAFKPFGDIFLNVLFVSAVPLIFFSIASAVASMASTGRLLKILGWMLVVFVATGIISSSLMVAGVTAYPPAEGVRLAPKLEKDVKGMGTADEIVRAFTAPDFVELLSKRNVLALIVFAMLVGLAARGRRGGPSPPSSSRRAKC